MVIFLLAAFVFAMHVPPSQLLYFPTARNFGSERTPCKSGYSLCEAGALDFSIHKVEGQNVAECQHDGRRQNSSRSYQVWHPAGTWAAIRLPQLPPHPRDL